MSIYKKNKLLLEKTHNYKSDMEHDACGVGLIASTNGKKTRKVVEYGIEALKAIWHRGAVDADGEREQNRRRESVEIPLNDST